VRYTPRTAGNVVSRLARASRILEAKRLTGEPEEVIFKLERCREFQMLTSSVRSQIKRAVRLQAEFGGCRRP
jgi:DNA (cytosine-5)-methyltransferase 1